MLGLFGTLNMGVRSLTAQRQGVEVAGHNLANVNNPAYARQRLRLDASQTIATTVGPQGTGVEATGITQVRDTLLDRQIEVETSVTGSLEAQQRILQYTQAALGQQIDRQSSGANGAATAQAAGAQQGIAENLSDLFNAFQSASTNPTSLAERQVLLMKAQNLTGKFNQVDQRLADLRGSINDSITTDVANANQLIKQIAKLNDQITTVEKGSPGVANDLRDTRQQSVEALAKLIKVDVSADANGAVDLSVGGLSLVSGNQAVETLQTYDAGGGQLLLRGTTSGANITPTAGTLHGAIEVRDGAVRTLRDNLNSLASLLVTEVNNAHRNGFGLNGTTGADFFTGTSATDIKVNQTLVNDPSTFQASGTAGAAGDNQVALRLAQLADKTHPLINGQTFSQGYAQTVSALGQALASVNAGLNDQSAVQGMLGTQRDSNSGVSVDEEMTDLIKYRKAYEASAKLITTVEDMLDIVMNLKR